MKYLITAVLLLTGCAHKPLFERTGIIHDYVFQTGTSQCQDHQGLHFIVSRMTMLERNSEWDSFDDYSCVDAYWVRCQDGTVVMLNGGIKYCFISEAQIEDALYGQ